MINIEKLSYRYSSGVEALKNITIKLPPEHIFAILGRSGSGKTTLLKCLGKFLKPQKGTITYKNQNIYEMKEVDFRRTIGIVFQELYLFPHLKVLENLILAPVKVLRMDRQTAENEARGTLEKLGIIEIADAYPAQISGGQAQRVAIARALLLKPTYLLLDEPTSALDVSTTEDFGHWLLHLKAETSFVIVTHDVLFANSIATSGVLIEKGAVKFSGKISEILKRMDYSIY
jgi:ABC-type polar amino acid transport system ATPase subunit